MLLQVLEERGVSNPVICTSINKIGFRMPRGIELYEKTIAAGRCRVIAMQALAAGAIPPAEAMEYVCRQPGIHSILYGASTRGHIKQTKELIEFNSKL
jgi:aryl-alcohol dehydrogenase-like predicted oxidoreductase